jgi:hypothetical protein
MIPFCCVICHLLIVFFLLIKAIAELVVVPTGIYYLPALKSVLTKEWTSKYVHDDKSPFVEQLGQ